MSRKTKVEKQQPKEIPLPVVEMPQLVEFPRALLDFPKEFKREHLLKHREALTVYVRKQFPSLMASQEDWNRLFEKF